MYDFFSPAVITAFLVCLAAASATIIGAFTILFTRGPSPRLLSFGLAFAGGAMVYVSLVEIFAKSHRAFLEIAPDQTAYAAATFSFFTGMMAMILLDYILPNPHLKLIPRDKNTHSHTHTHLKRISIFATLAITAHNLPEGCATFFATLDHPNVGISLAVAIALHNIPEGISVAIPVYFATGSKRTAFLATLISALAEPLGAILGYTILAPFLSPFVYGGLFGFMAGAMVYLALDELLPTSRRYAKGHETVYGLVSGMMILAISLALFR
jgi:ZIP family zinc transporter